MTTSPTPVVTAYAFLVLYSNDQGVDGNDGKEDGVGHEEFAEKDLTTLGIPLGTYVE